MLNNVEKDKEHIAVELCKVAREEGKECRAKLSGVRRKKAAKRRCIKKKKTILNNCWSKLSGQSVKDCWTVERRMSRSDIKPELLPRSVGASTNVDELDSPGSTPE